MSQSPSEPILAWLRQTLKDKGMNVAGLAHLVGLNRAEVKRVLGGRQPLTVDQLVSWTQALEVGLEDLVKLPEPEEEKPAAEATRPRLMSVAAARVPQEPEGPDPFTIDPYAVQGEQAVRLAFALGVNFTFVVDSSQLGEASGVPANVRERFAERMPIQLDAQYHRFNEPTYDEEGLGLTLSFGGTKHRSFFPWSAVVQVIYFIEPPEADEPEPEPEEEPSSRPTLRLVK